MLDEATLSAIRANARDFLKGLQENPLSIGKIRDAKKNRPIFALLMDESGRIVFACMALDPGYKTLTGYAAPYALPTKAGWRDMTKEEIRAIETACAAPFILLFLDEEGVIEHLRLNPTGALLWAVRFFGWNTLQPHQEYFASLSDVWMQ